MTKKENGDKTIGNKGIKWRKINKDYTFFGDIKKLSSKIKVTSKKVTMNKPPLK